MGNLSLKHRDGLSMIVSHEKDIQNHIYTADVKIKTQYFIRLPLSHNTVQLFSLHIKKAASQTFVNTVDENEILKKRYMVMVPSVHKRMSNKPNPVLLYSTHPCKQNRLAGCPSSYKKSIAHL